MKAFIASVLITLLVIALVTSVTEAKPKEEQCVIQSKIVERIAEFRDKGVRVENTKRALPKPWWRIAEDVYSKTHISPAQYKQNILLRCLDAQLA